MKIKTSDGKYEFRFGDGDYRIHVLRHGEPWHTIDEGSKAILTLMIDVEDARSRIAELESAAAGQGEGARQRAEILCNLSVPSCPGCSVCSPGWET